MDQKGPAKAPVEATPVSIPTVHKPPTIAANAPEGVSIGALTSPINLGSNASLTISTNPASTCTISVIYNSKPATDSGLAPKVADDYGIASWTWTVGKDVPMGDWPIKVSCAHSGRSAVVQTMIQVTKSD